MRALHNLGGVDRMPWTNASATLAKGIGPMVFSVPELIRNIDERTQALRGGLGIIRRTPIDF
jgi:hypothetical protein